MWLKKNIVVEIYHLPKKPSLFAGALNVQRKEEEFIKKKKNTQHQMKMSLAPNLDDYLPLTLFAPPEEA